MRRESCDDCFECRFGVRLLSCAALATTAGAAPAAAMPKKAKGGGDAGAPKEKLPNELEQMLITKLNALQQKFDAQVRQAEEAGTGTAKLSESLEKERLDRKDNVDYLQAELSKKQSELDGLKAKFVALQEERDNQVRRLKADLEKAKDTVAQQGQQLAQLHDEVASKGDQLLELGALKTKAADGDKTMGELSAEVESLRLKLHESSQHHKVLGIADGREGGQDGERVMPMLLLEVLRMHPAKPILAEQAMIALQYVLSSDRHADAEVCQAPPRNPKPEAGRGSRAHMHRSVLHILPTRLTVLRALFGASQIIRIRHGVDLILDVMRQHQSHGDLQSAACGLIWKIAFADPDVRVNIAEANGIAQIMGAMQHHATHPRLHYNACGALRHLLVTAPRHLSDPSQLSMGHGHGLPGGGGGSALPPLRGGRSSGGTRSGTGLSKIPVGAPPRMLLAGGSGVASRSGLRGVSSDPHLRNNPGGGGAGGSPLRPSTVAGPSRPKPDLPEVKPVAREEVSTQALHLTLRSMADNPNTPLVQEYGCGTLYNLVLASPQPTRAAILHNGGVQILTNAMRAHAMAAGVQINACALIKEIAEYQPCLKQLDQLGARELLHAAVHNHQFNAELAERAAEALRYLPDAPTGLDM